MEGNDMPIIELPEHYSVNSERLGMALAHVSAQANRLTEVHAALTACQVEQEAQQMRYVEERVAEARLEAESRTQALVCAINKAYGDPTALERRVDDRIQGVLVTLQESILQQARALAEAQLASQDAVHRVLEEQIRGELLVVQEQAALRIEKSVEAAMNKMSSGHQQVLQQQSTAELERHQLHTRMSNLEQNFPQTIDIAVAKPQNLAVSESE